MTTQQRSKMAREYEKQRAHGQVRTGKKHPSHTKLKSYRREVKQMGWKKQGKYCVQIRHVACVSREEIALLSKRDSDKLIVNYKYRMVVSETVIRRINNCPIGYIPPTTKLPSHGDKIRMERNKRTSSKKYKLVLPNRHPDLNVGHGSCSR